MAGTVNRVFLIGFAGKNAEVANTKNGTNKMANFSIATTDRWKDKNTGERMESSHWHRIVVFNNELAEFIGQRVKKGTMVMVTGKLMNRKWTDKDNIERYTTEVVIQGSNGDVQIVEGGDNIGQGGGGNYPVAPDSPTAYGAKPASQRRPQQPPPGDEIPF